MSARVAVVGDIHGDIERLNAMLDDHWLRGRCLVFLGDYVNRGSRSRSVIERLNDLASSAAFPSVTFIAGNHDIAFREVLRGGPLLPLLSLGGGATVRSWVPSAVGDVAEQLRRAVTQREVGFFERLVSRWQNGAYVAAHALEDLPAVLDQDVKYVVGHHIQRDRKPKFVGNVAFLDTGCGSLAEGVLSALLLPEERFISH